MPLCLLLAFHIYGCLIGSDHIHESNHRHCLSPLFSLKSFFDVDARYFISVLTQHFLRRPIHHSGHPTLKTISVIGALDKSWLRLALGCAGKVAVVFVATLLIRFDWLALRLAWMYT